MELIKLINLDTKIKKIYNYLVDLLKQKGLFDNSLEVQVLNVSCQIYQYQRLINAFVDTNSVVEPTKTEKGYKYQRNPITTDLINLSESLRKNLRELGLSLESKVTGVSNTDPLSNLINEMNNIE
jgi:phage terminase small subunit